MHLKSCTAIQKNSNHAIGFATNIRYCQRKMNFRFAILLNALMWLDCHNKEDLHKMDELNYTIGLKYLHKTNSMKN